MSNKEIKLLLDESMIILDYLHQHNVKRFNEGKADHISQSAIECREAVTSTYKNANLRGLNHLRKDLKEISSALPLNVRKEVKAKLAALKESNESPKYK